MVPRRSRSPRGILIVPRRASRPPVKGKEAPKPDAWWVLRDNPALSGTDIRNPEQNFDQQGGGPIVTMEFTKLGKTGVP